MSNKPVVVASMDMLYLRLNQGSLGAALFLKMVLLVGLSPRNISRRSKKVFAKQPKAVFWPDILRQTIKVRLYDGSFHEVDSNEMAFKMAGSMAFKEGVQKAGPVLLEPIMKVEVVVPEEFLGDIIGQMNSRRGDNSG